MNTGCTSIGETIKVLREIRGITQAELSEKAGISESHMNKIEAGARRPGFNTYLRIIEVLGVDMVIINEEKSVKERCMVKAQNILLNSTDAQAKYLIGVLEYMFKNINTIT